MWSYEYDEDDYNVRDGVRAVVTGAVAEACSFAWKMDKRHLLLSVVLFLVQRFSVQC